MSRLEELFDEFLFRAKNAADAAGQKTTDVVEFSKLKYQIKQVQWDIEKCYAKLGAFVYESKKSEEDFGDLITLAVNEIDLLNEKLDALEAQILACKKVVKCSDCGKENDLHSYYCSRCGSSLTEERAEYERETGVSVEQSKEEDKEAGSEE